MPNQREKYFDLIQKQTQNEDTKILNWFLKHIKTNGQWNCFTICKWENNERVIYPTEELRNLYKSKL